MRQCRQVFRGEEDDDFTVGTARVKFQRSRPTRQGRGDGRKSVVRNKEECSRSTVLSMPLKIAPAIKVARTATAVVEVLNAKRNEEPEWKKEWEEWAARMNEREDEADDTAPVEADTAAALPDTPLFLGALPCVNEVDEQEVRPPLEKDDAVGEEEEDGEDGATPPITPPTSPPSSACGADFSWSRSSSVHKVVPWDTALYYF